MSIQQRVRRWWWEIHSLRFWSDGWGCLDEFTPSLWHSTNSRYVLVNSSWLWRLWAFERQWYHHGNFQWGQGAPPSSAHAHKDPEMVNLPLLFLPAMGSRLLFWVLRTSSSCCVFLFPVKVSIISFFHFQILSFPPTSTELTEGRGSPVPQTQDHREKKDCGFMVWSYFWPQYPLLVPSDPGTKSGVADYLWGRDWNKHYAVAWESIFCREAQRRRLHSRDPVCRAEGLRCVFLCQQLNHSLTETLLFCAQISWFSLFVACGSSRQAPLPPTYSSLCQGQTWVCR